MTTPRITNLTDRMAAARTTPPGLTQAQYTDYRVAAIIGTLSPEDAAEARTEIAAYRHGLTLLATALGATVTALAR